MTVDQAGHVPLPSDPSVDALPVLWICGAPGAGKSAVAWEVFTNHGDEQVAYVDIDQLKMLAPEPEDSFDLAAANFSALVDVHRGLGTQALIVSGVIDPEQLPILESGVSGKAKVSWCLVDADDEVLRHRTRERGWPEHLVDMVITDARHWRASPETSRVDTTSSTPADAAKAVEAMWVRRPITQPSSLPLLDVAERSDLVVIYGPRAVGKSTISWGLFMSCANRSAAIGFLDADQLGFVNADAALRDRLIHLAVESIARNFRDAGARLTIVNGNLSSNLIAALGHDRTVLVHLDASDRVLSEHVDSRHDSNDARLAGDDLVGASDETRAAVLEQAQRQRDEYAMFIRSAHLLEATDTESHIQVRALAELLAGQRESR